MKSTCWFYIKVAGDIPRNTRGKFPAPGPPVPQSPGSLLPGSPALNDNPKEVYWFKYDELW